MLLLPASFASFKAALCVGVMEKRATSLPEIRALHTSSTIIKISGAALPIILSGRAVKRKNSGLGSNGFEDW